MKEFDKVNIARIIYWWRRYEGIKHKDTQGKFYDFSDLDKLERRLKAYFDNPEKFKFEKPDMDIEF